MKGMRINWNAIQLFRIGAHVWVILFILTSIPAYDTLWLRPVSPPLPAPSIFGIFTHAFTIWANGMVPVGIAILLIACMYQLMRASRWYISLLVWMIFTSLINLSWLAASGGQQLISIMLFWLIFIPAQPAQERVPLLFSTTAFWIMRLQLLLAYAATAIHKSTGTHWLEGTALGIASTDPAFNAGSFILFPPLAMLFTWSILFFQIGFPIAVWWRYTRVPWMIAGILFHLATAIWLGIPEMAFAFIICYALWLNGPEAERLMTMGRLKAGGGPVDLSGKASR